MVGDSVEVLRQLVNVGQLFHGLGLPCLQRLATTPHLGDVGLGDKNIALPFLFLTAASNCSNVFSRSSRAFCNVDLVAFAALIQSALFEGALSALSSYRKPRRVEEHDIFDVVFVLFGKACASALKASLAS